MMSTLLTFASGTFWTLTYLLIIRQGFRDRTYGMPLVALCANLSWEFLFSFVHPHPGIQHWVNLVWFFLDAIIFYQLLRYGTREFPNLQPLLFYGMVLLVFVSTLTAIELISREFQDPNGVYAAFGQNLMMSGLFIALLLNRNSLRGQSLWIAVSKLLGTAAASVNIHLYADIAQGSVLLPFLSIAIFIYDSIYVALVYRYRNHSAKENHSGGEVANNQ